ncbi:hypothetical protein [Candidatus Lokiarchaeum ossiferum]|uniref:hypothetical protein n=1 Tax=Candidatus Lokiarchaeum ossiferum TaxID=2951803 RepID=UPI00352C5A51
MPFCNACAVFEPKLDENGFCNECSMKYVKGEISEQTIKNQIRLIENQLDLHSLTYTKNLDYAPLLSTSQISSSTSLLNTLINEEETIRDNENNIQGARDMQNHDFRRSSIALTTSILGFILLFIPSTQIIGFVLITSGMIMAISARRLEGRNWRQLAATGISFIFWILIIITIIMLMNDPTLLDQLATT